MLSSIALIFINHRFPGLLVETFVTSSVRQEFMYTSIPVADKESTTRIRSVESQAS